MKNSERILIYHKKLLLSLFLSHNPKSTIVLYKNKNFPKIAAFVKIIEKMQPIDENSERILIYQQKFLLSLFLCHNLKSTIVLYKMKSFHKYEFFKNYLKMQPIDEKL